MNFFLMKTVTLLLALLVWGIGCYSGYLLIVGITKIIKMPRLSGVLVLLGFLLISYRFGLFGYISKNLPGKLAGAFLLGLSLVCGIVIWTGDEVLF